MYLKYIDNNKYINKIEELYLNSFPEDERFPFWILEKASKENNSDLYAIIENDKFVLKDSFFVLKELDIKECYYIISSLNSYFGVTVMRETWICIYSKNETKRFRYGVSNGQKYLGIQLIYSKENLEFIDKYIERKY